MRQATGLSLLFVLAWTAAARADAPGTDDRRRRAVTGQPEPEVAAPGEESEELAALREFEERAFRPRPTFAADEPAPAGGSEGAAAPGVSPPTDQDEARARLLQNVILPDLPIRWDEKVLQYVDWFHDDPRGRAVMSSWLRRMGRFEGHLRRKLAERGMPQDLVFVAMNESGFVPTARSPAGAVGLWQFMPDAGEIYGLRQNRWRDDRRDPIRATEAAAEYLSDLFTRFGDWHLVLAAYNMGYGGLLRAIRKYNTNDYWALSRREAGLPWETTTYVPKILAAALIGKNRQRFGFQDVPAEPAWSFDVVTVPGACDLAIVARAAGVPRSEVVALNPALLRGRTPPGEDEVEVRVPERRGAAFGQAFQRLRSQWRAYRGVRVRFGETLERLAHRYRTTTTALRNFNDLGARQPLVPGEMVVVPNVTPRPDADPEDPPVVVVPDRTLPTQGTRFFYQAIAGDSTRDVARAFGVSLSDMARWNDVSTTARLQSGQWLQVFVPEGADLSQVVAFEERQVRVLVAGSAEFFEHHESQRGRRRIVVTVREGDTLSHFAQRFDLSIGSICRINGINPQTPIRVGQDIVVYAPVDRLPAEEPAAGAASDSAETPTTAESRVAAGDSPNAAPAAPAVPTAPAVPAASAAAGPEPATAPRPAETDGAETDGIPDPIGPAEAEAASTG